LVVESEVGGSGKDGEPVGGVAGLKCSEPGFVRGRVGGEFVEEDVLEDREGERTLEFVKPGVVEVGDEGVKLLDSRRKGEEGEVDVLVGEEAIAIGETGVDDRVRRGRDGEDIGVESSEGSEIGTRCCL